MSTVSEQTLMAYVDGELDELAWRRTDRAVAADPDLQRLSASQQRLKARLKSHYAPVAQERIPDRLLAPLDTNVIAFSAARPTPKFLNRRNAAAMAASFAVGMMALQLMPSEAVLTTERGVLMARGDLASALDTQLASSQPANAPTRIGVSFLGENGRFCRTFESPSFGGIGCRGDSGWKVVMTVPGSSDTTEFRQAGSGNALVMEAAQSLMAGEPLDAGQERLAKASGWKPEAAVRSAPLQAEQAKPAR